MRLSLSILSFLTLIVALASGCRKPQEGTVEGSLDQGGRTRTYLIHLPPNHDPVRQWPMIISLHGHGGQGVDQEKLTSMTTLAEDEGVVVVYPNGVDRSWNDDRNITE